MNEQTQNEVQIPAVLKSKRGYGSWIAIAVVCICLLFAAFKIGQKEGIQSSEPKTLTAEYIKQAGFTQLQGGALIYNIQEVVPGVKPDTIRATMATVPINKDGRSFFAMGMLINNRFFPIDALYERKDFDQWMDIISTEK